jgi:hypothetical protein
VLRHKEIQHIHNFIEVVCCCYICYDQWFE